ncbi:MAG: hypothetical protein NT166_27855 [Candidatus Aminicenantes bacterium]|nr:hypothetical protein [Candidatus Aminicenantes bacterium]
MKIKILAIVLIILFTCGLNLVISDVGGGGTPPSNNNCPCYSVGQFVSQYGWWQGGSYYSIIETYIGNCQIRSDWYRNGQWFQYTVNAGGCTCPCNAIPD